MLGDLRGIERLFWATEVLTTSLGLAARAAYIDIVVEDGIMKIGLIDCRGVWYILYSWVTAKALGRTLWSTKLVFQAEDGRIDDTIIIIICYICIFFFKYFLTCCRFRAEERSKKVSAWTSQTNHSGLKNQK